MTHFNNNNIFGKALITPLGGIAQKFVNKTGETSVYGKWVSSDSSVAGAVKLCAQDKPDPIGVVFSAGVPDGQEIFVVTSGVGEGLFSNAPTLGYIARGYVAADTPAFTAGLFLSEAIPGSPFNVDKHFYEGGHILETKTAAGTATVNLHFN
jgi:hypothetical protein